MSVAIAHSAPVSFHEFVGDADWWAIRDLLVRTHASTQVGWNWDIRRWDGSRFHRESLEQSRLLQNGIGLWEADGRLVAAMHCEDGGDAFFELDPAIGISSPRCSIGPRIAWRGRSTAAAGCRSTAATLT
jgi:hypothetical protein